LRLLVIRRADELGVKGRSTLIIKIGNSVRERALRDVDAVLIIGSRVKVSSALPPVLALHGIPLTFMAKDHVAITVNPIMTRYNNYRRLQYQLPKKDALTIALEYIKARINGMINILKYHRVKPPEIPTPPDPISDEEAYETEIRIWESVSSSTLWPHLLNLINDEYLRELREKYGFTGRKPRHPDPFNKTLSVMYAVLYSLATKALIAAGLDPTYGFLHRTRYSTPLTFDYTEMFKPIAIQATINMINREGLPVLDVDGELEREWVNKAIKQLYSYLTLRHKDTNKTLYQQIYLKAFCLAKHLEGKCPRDRLTVTWDRRQYRLKTTK
jgi:CRISPR-associated protein Cas1